MTDYVNFVKAVESTSWHQPNERLLHGVMGLCTEIAEIIECDNNDHALEEMGDIFWYLALSHDALGLEFEPILMLNEDDSFEVRGEAPFDSWHIYATDLLDMVKKQIFYGRAIDLDKAKHSLFMLHLTITIGCLQAGMDLEEIIERNVKKLKTRYPGKFSEEAAINRDVKAEYAAMNG